MGQKTRPTGFRIGIVEEWRSRWYASKKEFGDLLAEDNKIRTFIKKKYLFAGIPKIIIERTRDQVIVHLHCPPGDHHRAEGAGSRSAQVGAWRSDRPADGSQDC